ncbi:Vacuolar protein sorting/targeting protein like [Actinidia chinensis var. chinensis]|uniref:Vacuolar protein sorting/targeting protein like n=1 Tax=Actinidia chinensis var. chinensis TaxID=1590841 RepID=A0A2R6R5Y8_ACTCC|nr:Vacuolar protein sorting/targeting protein like [Actinidia chinensis var. chinensis]
MQDPSMLLPKEASVPKPRKKKPSTQKGSTFQQGSNVKGFQEVLPPLPIQSVKKASKRVLKNEVNPLFQQPENSPSDSLPDSSTSGNEYRALRRKYLLLEEESFGLGSELREVEDVVKTLEEEKLALLDDLVVLEGLMDPSELQSQGKRLPLLPSC